MTIDYVPLDRTKARRQLSATQHISTARKLTKLKWLALTSGLGWPAARRGRLLGSGAFSDDTIKIGRRLMTTQKSEYEIVQLIINIEIQI